MFIISVAFFCGNIKQWRLDKNCVRLGNTSDLQSPLPSDSKENNLSEKCVGVWISYLDLKDNSPENTEKNFKNKFENMVRVSKDHGINTIIAHVRPFGDALYPSKYFPWSHIITGTQGVDPKFDPLKIMIDLCHENNMKFHAWINPLRIKNSAYPSSLSENNPFFKFDKQKHFIYHSNGICYNPAYKETRELIVNGIKEIMENYNIDAIHFDDYFYPEENTLTSKDFAYEEYLAETQEKEKLSTKCWRKNQINILIQQVYEKIKSINPKVEFGISPPGNLEKCGKTGLDIYKLCFGDKVFLDYICPQIYWSTDYKTMPFENTASAWHEIFKNSNIKIYGGLAVYKAGTDLDDGTWKLRNNILSNEIDILKNLNYSGVMLYSWQHINSPLNKEEIDLLTKEIKKNFL